MKLFDLLLVGFLVNSCTTARTDCSRRYSSKMASDRLAAVRKNAGKNVIRQQAAVSAPFNASVTGVLAARDACNRLRIKRIVSAISRNTIASPNVQCEIIQSN
jgi:hypothetical protein